VGKDAGAPVHFAVVNGVETDDSNPMKQFLAQSELVDIRRRCPLHPHVHMARIVHEVAKAGMGLQPAATRQVHSTRRDVVDCGVAIFLKRRDLLAWFWDLIVSLLKANVQFRTSRFRKRIGSSVLDVLWDLIVWLLEANVHFRNGRFRECIGSSVLDVFWDLIAWLLEVNAHFRNGHFRKYIGSSVVEVLIRRQWVARKHPNGRPEPLVEGGRAIISRAEKTLLKRRVRARGRGRICQHWSRLGPGIEQSDLRFQACHS
jgi:hypothetical protein